MKRLTLHRAVFGVAFILASSAALAEDGPPRGARIGDGKLTPREIVPNKPAKQRLEEITSWLISKNASKGRHCPPKAGHVCATTYLLKLTNNQYLSVRLPDLGVGNYCRQNEHLDTAICFSFDTESYFIQTRNGETWTTVWDEKGLNEKGGETKPANNDTIEM